MKLRIAIWAAAGALVVLMWSLYFMAMRPIPVGTSLALLDLTCPVALFRSRPLTIYFVLAMNAATYALAGMIVETIRWQYHRARLARK